MAYVCKIDGCLTIKEYGEYMERRSLSKNGTYEIEDSSYGDDWDTECYDCSNSELFEFDEDYLKEEDLTMIHDKLDRADRVLYIMVTELERMNKEKMAAFNVVKKEIVKYIEDHKQDLKEMKLWAEERLVLLSI